jgi:hypothetical protein
LKKPELPEQPTPQMITTTKPSEGTIQNHGVSCQAQRMSRMMAKDGLRAPAYLVAQPRALWHRNKTDAPRPSFCQRTACATTDFAMQNVLLQNPFIGGWRRTRVQELGDDVSHFKVYTNRCSGSSRNEATFANDVGRICCSALPRVDGRRTTSFHVQETQDQQCDEPNFLPKPGTVRLPHHTCRIITTHCRGQFFKVNFHAIIIAYSLLPPFNQPAPFSRRSAAEGRSAHMGAWNQKAVRFGRAGKPSVQSMFGIVKTLPQMLAATQRQ